MKNLILKCGIGLVFLLMLVGCGGEAEPTFGGGGASRGAEAASLSRESILQALRDNEELLIYEFEQSRTEEVDESNLFGRLKQEITFFATSRIGLLWNSISAENILRDSDGGVIQISLPTPVNYGITPDYSRAEYSDTDSGLLRRSEIQMTAEEETELRREAVNNMETDLRENHIEPASAYIAGEITKILNGLLVDTGNAGRYEIRVLWQ
ncbi:MAG: hypothetical protein FWG87_09890 [Defluviitaleaceae bacterium]|nr:hypothetical protein [Defluviitaleaceae bacterium]